MNTICEPKEFRSPADKPVPQHGGGAAPTGVPLAGGAALLLAACGGGGEDDLALGPTPYAKVEDGAALEGAPDHLLESDASRSAEPDLAGADTDEADTLQTRSATGISRQEAARFLQQAAFGGNASAINAVVSRGFAGWIDWQASLRRGTDRYSLLAPAPEDGKAPRHYRRLDDILWRKLMTGSDVLRQRVALALSEIFVVSMEDTRYSWCGAAVADYMDRLEACALGTPGQAVVANGPGTYRHLLEKVTLSHAMGRYLSMFESKKADNSGRSPDENYAREVLQLFSIGLYQLKTNGQPKLDAAGQRIETYRNADVTALARVFTGWFWNGFSKTNPAFIRRDMGKRAEWHDTGDKVMPTLGWTIRGNADAAVEMKAVLDRIAGHSNVGPFIGRQLIQRLVTSNPSPSYVSRIARVFNNNGAGVRGDLRAVVKAILLDPEARTVNTGVRGGRLIPPMYRLAQWARTFAPVSNSGNWIVGDTSDPNRKLGQSPLRSPSVFNFYRPGYVHPGTPGTLTAGMGASNLTLPEFQITNEVSVIGYVNFMRATIAGGGDLRATYAAWLPLADRPAQLFDELNTLLAAGRLGSNARSLIVGAVTAMKAATDDASRAARVGAMVWLIMCSPQYLIQR